MCDGHVFKAFLGPKLQMAALREEGEPEPTGNQWVNTDSKRDPASSKAAT
jgi:hypothetical protein